MKIALVIPWFGKKLKGGAEQLAWQVASRLAGRGHLVEVLTTCSEGFLADWDVDFFQPGKEEEKEERFTIRRFPVTPRNRDKFDQVCHHLLTVDRLSSGVCPVSIEMADDFSQHNINSEELLVYLNEHAAVYDAFFFLPYLYGPILNGLPLVKDKAILQPCLHDESYAYLPDTETLFRCCKKILFNSHGEFQLALNLYGPGIYAKSLIVGSGVELLDQGVQPAEDELFDGYVSYKYFLYAGRRDNGKNIDLLCTTFRRYKQVYGGNIKLVLIGPGVENFSDSTAEIVDLELVPESTKRALLYNCLALVNPSENESYSRVMMEAWQAGRPVVAHQNCLATAMAVESSGGGWVAGSKPQQWVDTFVRVAESVPEVLKEKGALGKKYAAQFADWDTVIDCYEDVFASIKDTEVGEKKYSGLAIHQALPNLSYGDAISNHALAVRKYLLSQGADSRIFALHFHEKVCKACEVFELEKIKPANLVIYHHSIGNEITDKLCQHNGLKFLVYHNITPAHFFKKYSPIFEQLMENGRRDLPRFASCFEYSGGDSLYNCQELHDVGFKNPIHLPLVLDPSFWNYSVDPEVMKQMGDGCKNILFTGRIAPNKCQHDLVEAFERLITLIPDVRLVLVGGFSPAEAYYQELQQKVSRLGLSRWVHIPGHVSDEELHAYFRTAHLYWSMSEHEGFGVPLIEAMWFDVPVFAFKSSAVPETLGNAGMMFTQKNNLPMLAEAARQLLVDTTLREKIIRAQRVRREELLPKHAFNALDYMLRAVLELE